MNKNPMQTAARRAKKARLLGEHPICIVCGCAEFDAILTVKARLLEGHHVIGRKLEPEVVVPLCRNCHARVTEVNRGLGLPATTEMTVPEMVIAVLETVGAFLVALGEALLRWAERLERHETDRALAITSLPLSTVTP